MVRHNAFHRTPDQFDAYGTPLPVCSRCSFGSMDSIAQQMIIGPMTTRVPSSLLKPPGHCALDDMMDDILLHLSRWLSTTSLYSLAAAYQRFDDLTRDALILQRREIRCTGLRNTSIASSDAVFGIRITGAGQGLFRTEWLSKAAYEHLHVRVILPVETNSTAQGCTYPTLFIPLAINPDHFHRAHLEIHAALDDFGQHLFALDPTPARIQCNDPNCGRMHVLDIPSPISTGRISWPFDETPMRRLRVLVWLITSTLEAIARKWTELVPWMYDRYHQDNLRSRNAHKDILALEDKTVDMACWCNQFLYLILSMFQDDHRILQEARSIIMDHIRSLKDQTFRTYNQKVHARDTQSLVLLMIVSLLDGSTYGGAAQATDTPCDKTPLSWSTIRDPYIYAYFSASTTDLFINEPSLEILEDGVSDFRLVKTFAVMQPELRSLAIQLAFVRAFTSIHRSSNSASTLERMSKRHGYLETQQVAELLQDLHACNHMSTWREFFKLTEWAEMENQSKEAFCEWLRAHIQVYIKPTRDATAAAQVSRLREERDKAERKWYAETQSNQCKW